ncbi:ATPase [Halobacteriales archaeon QS_1_68_17]|nr:MAG: ATPase [Halobacteriales archaeon QS_1_68_17]
MGDEETITVAEVSEGPCGTGEAGAPVGLPVVEILTGRGFVTGKSGSGKSNSVSVIAEKLLDEQYALLIVDIDGEYYGLKEEYEILHVGGDDECDIQVGPEHAEKIASLALEQNVPIILDISSFLDEEVARELLCAVSKQLFAKEKKLKQPFLMIVEEVHEYIPEGGAIDECGKWLIKIGKRGRKHGLGITGISQRPADVKKDFITQCDWLVWHRLTWKNDTKVVGRVLDSDYAGAVEGLDDGEGFLMTDWGESVRRVQFQRKRTFDAGATPGLDDFERPDLKSVSDDLVSELAEISDEKEERESRVREVREQLDEKNSRIAELERELADARDMSRMADQFVEALVEHVRGANPGRTEQAKMRERRETRRGTAATDGTTDEPDRARRSSDAATPGSNGQTAADGTTAAGDTAGENSFEWPGENGSAPADADDANDDHPATGPAGWPDVDMTEATDSDVAANVAGTVGGDESDAGTSATERTTETGLPEPVAELRETAASLESTTREMLRYYREDGPGTPIDAQRAAGGTGDRTRAYARNRTLRTAGFIEHVGRGNYDYALRSHLRTAFDRNVADERLKTYVAAVEAALDE